VLKGTAHGFQRRYLTSDSRNFGRQERPSFIGAEPARVMRPCEASDLRLSMALRACVLEMLQPLNCPRRKRSISVRLPRDVPLVEQMLALMIANRVDGQPGDCCPARMLKCVTEVLSHRRTTHPQRSPRFRYSTTGPASENGAVKLLFPPLWLLTWPAACVSRPLTLNHST
jgi:hypothetical protein